MDYGKLDPVDAQYLLKDKKQFDEFVTGVR